MCGGIYLRCSRFAGRRIPGLLFGVQLPLGRMILCLMLSLGIAFGRCSRAKVFCLRRPGFGCLPVALAFPCIPSYWSICLAPGCSLVVLAFPCILIGLLASPLCGAAPTFFAAAKANTGRKAFTVKVFTENRPPPPPLLRPPDLCENTTLNNWRIF
jgi:hypothetical protein